MPSYSFEKNLPSYFVDRDFLKHVENFIQKKAQEFCGESYKPTRYRILIEDSLGIQTLESIDQFHHAQFPNDTKSIQVEYGLLGASFEIKVRFHIDRQRSNYRLRSRATLHGSRRWVC